MEFNLTTKTMSGQVSRNQKLNQWPYPTHYIFFLEREREREGTER